MQIWSEQGKVQKLFPKIDLGRSWSQFWRGLGHSGASFGNFWPHFGNFLDVQCGTWRLFGVILSILGALWVWFFRFWELLGASRALFSVKIAFWNAFLQNFIDLGRFWLGLGRVFGTFFRCFLHYLGTLRFCKNIEKTLFCKGRELLKISEKSIKFDQKSMQIWSEQKNAQKLSQKIHLGRSWRQFGRGLGHSGASFGYFWMHFGRLLGLRCGTWRLLGVILSILGALERVLAAIFGQSRVLKQFFSKFYRFWELLVRF